MPEMDRTSELMIATGDCRLRAHDGAAGNPSHPGSPIRRGAARYRGRGADAEEQRLANLLNAALQ
jgi:hypothetical protein